MILTDLEIREKVKEINLIENFEEDNLQSESYDLRLGDEISILDRTPRIISVKNDKDLETLYETKKLDENGYSLIPGEYVLAKIKEKINLPDNLNAHIRPRTRFTRLGLIVSDQHCNSTYCGNLQIGIFNATNSTIQIFPNINICQIVFEELKSIPSSDKQYKNKKDAAYQNEEEFRGPKVDEKILNELYKKVLGRD